MRTGQTIFGDRPVRTTGQVNKVWSALCDTSVTVVLIVLLYENWSDLLELTSFNVKSGHGSSHSLLFCIGIPAETRWPAIFA